MIFLPSSRWTPSAPCSAFPKVIEHCCRNGLALACNAHRRSECADRRANRYGKSVDYFVKAMNDRRRTPQNDMITTLVQAKMPSTKTKNDNNDARPLNDAELLGFLLMLIAAGYETVNALFGLTIYNLYKNPDVRRELIQNTALIPGAVEEFLRYDNPGQYLARITTRDVVIQGVTIPKGEKLFCYTAQRCATAGNTTTRTASTYAALSNARLVLAMARISAWARH